MQQIDPEIWKRIAIQAAEGGEGRPFFIYREDILQDNSRKIRSALNTLVECKTDFFFSMKTNPNTEICRLLVSMGWGIDVSSERELRMARSLLNANQVQFSGCAKEARALRRSLSLGVHRHHIDSLDEWRWFVRHDPSRVSRLSIRLSYEALFSFAASFSLNLGDQAPDAFAMKHGLSYPEALSVMSEASQLGRPLWGLHFYLGREQFSPSRLRSTLATMASIAQKNSQSFGDDWSLSVGPGFPGTLPQAEEWTNPGSHFGIDLSKLRVDFEVGRGLVGSAGVYGAQVLSVKKWDNGRTSVVVNGGVQHVGSSLRPLYSRKTSEELPEFFSLRQDSNSRLVLNSESTTMEGAVFGSLCLGHDVLLAKARLPQGLKRGDWLIFFNAGAYGVTAGVPRFIHQDLPREFLCRLDGELVEVTHHHFGSSDLLTAKLDVREREL